VTSNALSAAWKQSLQHRLVYFAASAFIVAVMAGLLLTVSCAHTPQGLQRETQVYLTASNAIERMHQLSPYVPPQTSPIFEGILAAGGALLALWATHLQRTVAELRSNQPPRPAQASPPPPPPPQPQS
jgi:hypothetical protein